MEVGIEVFWSAVGTSSVPFIPFVGAIALYRAFIMILKKITALWGIVGAARLIEKSKVRNQFLRGCFDTSVGGIIGSQFLLSVNIIPPISAAVTAEVVLKMIAGITLIYEMLFWRMKQHPERLLTVEIVEQVVTEFQSSREQQKMSDRLGRRISLNNCYNKAACFEELKVTVEESRNSRK
jgi:hypothetical protein